MEKEIIVFSRSAGTLTARISCEIDHHTAGRLRSRIDRELFVERPRVLCLDFKDVRFMDSSGIGVVMGRYKQVQYAGGEVYVYGIGKSVDRIFQMSGLYRLVKEYRMEKEGGN